MYLQAVSCHALVYCDMPVHVQVFWRSVSAFSDVLVSCANGVAWCRRAVIFAIPGV